jgi:hypothetical protein
LPDTQFIRANRRMSRAMNLRVEMDVAVSLCDRNGIGISAIEPLDSGGTRIVLMTNEGAHKLQRLTKGQLIDGPVVRSGAYQARSPIPYD